MQAEIQRQAAENFVKAMGYPEDPRVRAVFLIGSSASGEGDAYSDVDVMIAVNTMISDEERLASLHAVGCHNIMLTIAGINNPALPVKSEVIDKFVFQDVWFDVSYHLPDQLQFCFDYVTLVDKEGLSSYLCGSSWSYTAEQLRDRAQANLRLLHARIYRYKKYSRREEWIGLDLSAIKNLVVDIVMVLNDRPNYNRHASRITQLLSSLPTKPADFEQRLVDILHLDDRAAWEQKIEMLQELEADLTALCKARWSMISLYDDIPAA
ncbi:MAG: hypothetical protein JW900_14585 [Anaerolineae bacterium]|nr:hypothetical protein [Anaerolineae bacterium]